MAGAVNRINEVNMKNIQTWERKETQEECRQTRTCKCMHRKGDYLREIIRGRRNTQKEGPFSR